MSDEREVSVLMARLQANLAASGIPVNDDDLAEVVARGYLTTAIDFERAMARIPRDGQPDAGFPAIDRSGPTIESLAALLPPLDGAAPPRPLPPGHADAEPLAFATIAHVGGLLRAGRISALELTNLSLERIARYDPALNAFQTILAEEARTAARTADRELAVGQDRGPLHGIPVAVKDLFALRGTPTMAGSPFAWPDYDNFDATAVTRLRAAGAVIVGKTRMSEFAYSPGSNNAHYGPTANPWNTRHDTGGSSSGSGAAVAAGLVYAALGTDTGGSIRIPSALCGVVGIKPTFGRASMHGGVALSWSLDHLGPLARSVGDCALVLDVLAGPDPLDPRTMGAPPLRPARPIQGLRIGVLGDDGSGQPLGTGDVLHGWRLGLDALAAAGAELVPVDLPELDIARWVHTVTLATEAMAQHEDLLRTRWTEAGEFPRRRLLQSLIHAPSAYVRAQQARAVVRGRVREALAGVDLLSMPAMPAGAPALGTPASVRFVAPFNQIGLPAISIPVGLTDEGLPIGLQLVGHVGDEATVLRAAAALEASGIWRQPI